MPLPLPGFGPGEYQTLREFLLGEDESNLGTELRESFSPRAWLRFFALTGADVNVLLRHGWRLYRLLVRMRDQSRKQGHDRCIEEVGNCAKTLQALLEYGLACAAPTNEKDLRAIHDKVDNFKKVYVE